MSEVPSSSRYEATSSSASTEPRESTGITKVRAPYVSLYRLDLDKFAAATDDTVDPEKVIEEHVSKVEEKSEYKKTGIPERSLLSDAKELESCTKVDFEKKTLSQNPEQAKEGKTVYKETTFSIKYFVTKDKKDIYVAGTGYSVYYLKDYTHFEFPEQVMSRHLTSEVFSVHGKCLQGRLALYSKSYRRTRENVENLWESINQLTSKVTLAVGPDSSLRKTLDTGERKVLVQVNLDSNYVQIQRSLQTDEIEKVIDVLIESFSDDAPRQCHDLQLVSRVRDKELLGELDDKLNEYLVSVCSEEKQATATQEGTFEINFVAMNKNLDAWNAASEIRWKSAKQNGTDVIDQVQAKKKIRSLGVTPKQVRIHYKEHGQFKKEEGDLYFSETHTGCVTIKYLEPPSKKSAEHSLPWSHVNNDVRKLLRELYEEYKQKLVEIAFIDWLASTIVEFGVEPGEKEKLLALMECRNHFFLEDQSYMFFQGQWLKLETRLHSFLEIHFQELLISRGIDAHVLLPLPWTKVGSEDQTAQSKLKTFLETWLGKEIEDFPFDLRTALFPSKPGELGEPEYNECYLLLNDLINERDRGFIVGDGVTIDGIELFDLLYFDKTNVYFIHVKKGFNLKNMRVVADQVRQSAHFIQSLLMQDDDKWETKPLEKYFKDMKYCDETCRHRKGRKNPKKWACDLNAKFNRRLSVQWFRKCLRSHQIHFVLAYGGPNLDSQAFSKVGGDEIQNVLRKCDSRDELLTHGYAKCADAQSSGTKETRSPPSKKARYDENILITRRFCAESRENFRENVKDVVLYDELNAAIAQSESHASKFAILNLMQNFSSFKDLNLWLCRMSQRIPDEESVDDLEHHMQNMTM